MSESHTLRSEWMNPEAIGSSEPGLPGQLTTTSPGAAVCAPWGAAATSAEDPADPTTQARLLGDGKVGLPVKLAYAAPRFCIRAAYVEVQVYALLYYLQLGAELRVMAFYMAIGRSLDIVTDPLMGWITDSTRSAFGRRAPYLMAGVILYPLTFGLLFHPPVGVNTADWYGCFYILFFLVDTFVHVPYYALGMEITKDYDERTSVYYWQFLTGQLGILVGGVMPGVLSAFFGLGLRPTYYITGWSFGGFYAVGMAFLLCFVKEKPLAETARAKSAPMARDVVRILRNEAFIPLLMSMILDYGVVGMVSAMLPFYVQYIIVVPDSEGCVKPCQEWFQEGDDCDCGRLATLWLSYFVGTVFLSAVISTPFWLYVSKCTTKRNAWMAQSVWNVVTNPWFIFCTEGDIYSALFVAALNGSGFGGQFLNEAIVADVSDYDEFLYGDRLEGMLGTVGTLGPKIVLVFTGVLPLVCVAAAGFRSSEWPAEVLERDRLGQKPCEDADNIQGCPKTPLPQGDSVMIMIRLLFCIAPTVLAIISLFFKRNFPIKSVSQMLAIHEGTRLHCLGKPACDPVTGKTVMTVIPDDPTEVKQLHFLEMWGGAIGDNSKALKAILDLCLPGGTEPDNIKSKATVDRSTLRPIYVRAAIWVVGPALTFVAFFIATVGTHGMLDEASSSWVPTCCSILTGVALTFLIIGAMRLQSARSLPDVGISVALLQRVLWRTFDPAAASCSLEKWEEVMTSAATLG